MKNLSFGLLQCRNPGDSMLEHEVACFQEALEIARSQILPLNIVDAQPHTGLLDEVDVILVGGAGDYSVLDRSEFLTPFFQLFIEICERGIPTFASCFGFQAMCLALGGEIIKDLENTEVGTFQLCLTESGIGDDIFGILPETFCAQLGHKDRAAVLPADAINLATSDRSPFQAFKIENKPIYATQFHPELTMAQNRERFERYIAGYSHPEDPAVEQAIRQSFRPSHETRLLLTKFIDVVFR